MKLKIALIRHGKAENAEGKPSGLIDSPLSEDGKGLLREKCAAKTYPSARYVYSSGLLCCRETASLIYMSPVLVLKKLNTPDNGDFDGQALDKIREMSKSAMREIVAEIKGKNVEQCAIIAHKMVILAILQKHCVPRSSYADWEISFGGGYFIEYDSIEETAIIIDKI